MSEPAEKSPKPGRRNVLVISSVEHPVAVLREALGGNVDELKVVVPAVKQSRLQWLTNADDDAREEAEDAAASIDAATSDTERQRQETQIRCRPPRTRSPTSRPTSSWSSRDPTTRRPGSKKAVRPTSSCASPGSRSNAWSSAISVAAWLDVSRDDPPNPCDDRRQEHPTRDQARSPETDHCP